MGDTEQVKDEVPSTASAESDSRAKGELREFLSGELAKVGKVLGDHGRNLGNLKYIQTGILVVVGSGFVAMVIALFIFFCQTNSSYETTVCSLNDKNKQLEERETKAQMDTIRVEMQRLISQQSKAAQQK